MRVLVSGGRTYPYSYIVAGVLDDLAIDVLVTGGQSGVEEFARRWAKQDNIITRTHVADGKGSSQGMLYKERLDLVVCFPGGQETVDILQGRQRQGCDILQVDNMGVALVTGSRGG